MTSSEELRQDFLTCTICYDVYDKPKTLPCLHTFCLKCLSSYIIAEEDTFGVRRKRAFPCPVCRTLAKPQDHTKPLPQWAHDFKTNFYIENLMSALKVKVSSSEEPTRSDDQQRDTGRSSTDHREDVTDTPGTTRPLTPNIGDRGEYTPDNMRSLTQNTGDRGHPMNARDNTRPPTSSRTDNMRREESANSRRGNRVDSRNTRANVFSQSSTIHIGRRVESRATRNTRGNPRPQSSPSQTSLASARNNRANVLRRHSDRTTHYVARDSLLRPPPVSGTSRSTEDLTSAPTAVEESMTSLHSSMPDLNINSRDNVLISNLNPPYGAKTFQVVKCLSTRLDGDRRDPRLGGICVVDGAVVVLDPENFRVKSFFDWNVRLASNIVTKSVNFEYRPRSITEIPGNAVAVAVPSSMSIHMLKVTPFLQQFSVVQTTRKYKTIANSGSGSLVAIAVRSGSTVPRLSPIDILNFEGDTLRSVDISYQLKRIDFSHLAVSSSGLVHLVDPTGLYCVTQDGVELYRYTQSREQEQFKNLKGLCCRSNDVYLTDVEGHAVYEISCDCSLPATREKILSSNHGIRRPVDVHVGPDELVYVAGRDGYVRIYKSVKTPPISRSVETVV